MAIEQVIERSDFHHVFQPIYQLGEGKIEGYEGLLRTKHYSNPEQAFAQAEQAKKLYELDSRSIHKAVLTYQQAGFSENEGRLFLNVLPSTIRNDAFPSFLDHIMNEVIASRQQLVFEIDEQETIEDFAAFKDHIRCMKRAGVQIAIDDFGKGVSDMKRIIELEPDYIKLDRYFVEDLEHSRQKQAIIQWMAIYCRRFHIALILEGLEDSKDIAVANGLGIPIGQGFGLGHPEPLEKQQLI
ncbi:MAG TPA: EAL domain-containing protein [Bacillales bacterium]|nr:EAL domain-containing protein [Bacillales bacterium]